jgi:hypothetical protein
VLNFSPENFGSQQPEGVEIGRFPQSATKKCPATAELRRIACDVGLFRDTRLSSNARTAKENAQTSAGDAYR